MQLSDQRNPAFLLNQQDAEKLRSEVEATRYAVVFVIPRFGTSADAASVEKGINDAIELCRSERADLFCLHISWQGRTKG